MAEDRYLARDALQLHALLDFSHFPDVFETWGEIPPGSATSRRARRRRGDSPRPAPDVALNARLDVAYGSELSFNLAVGEAS